MNPWLPIEHLTALWLALAALTAWTGWRGTARARFPVRCVLVGLRLVALGALFLLALNFGHWEVPRAKEKAAWAVLADSSASMSTRDRNGVTRWTQATKIAQGLEDKSGKDVRFYAFDTDLRPVESPRKYSSEGGKGPQTDIVDALLGLAERFRSERLAGVILLSDGRQVPARDAEEATVALRAAHAPVYPIVLGETVLSVDLAVNARRSQYVSFPGQPVKVVARLGYTGTENIECKVRLRDAADQVLAEKSVPIKPGGEVPVAFEIPPRAPGYSTYSFQVEAWPGETALANNRAEFAVYTLAQKTRILLVEGMPHWDSKFMAQLLQRQQNVELSFIYRLAQERFFSQFSLAQSATNLSELPATAEALARFDLIVAGKGFEYFLNRDNRGALQSYLREHGGGLLFARGKAYSGDQPDLAALEPIEWGGEWSQTFSWQPTQSGEEAGLFGEGLPGRLDPTWGRLPELSRARLSLQPKVFAQVLAEGVSRFAGATNRFPVVASQRVGKGQVVTVNSEELWQWDFFPKFEGASAIYRDFWLELIHWSIAYGEFLPGHDWALHAAERTIRSGQTTRVRLTSRGSRGGACPTVSVARVSAGAAPAREISLAPTGSQPGEFEGVVTLNEPGMYRLEARNNSSSAPLVYETLTVRAPPAESDDPSPDPQWLAQLAAATEGRVIGEAELTTLLRPPAVTEDAAALENAQWASSWDRGHWLLLIAALFTCEWAMRRRHGLT